MIRLDTEFTDPDIAEKILNSVAESNIKKSFYNFDFSSYTGITSFLALLPLMDVEVVKQAASELWPGYVDDTFDLKRARVELRGYLMDVTGQGLVLEPEVEAQAAEEASNELTQQESEEDVGPSAGITEESGEEVPGEEEGFEEEPAEEEAPPGEE